VIAELNSVSLSEWQTLSPTDKGGLHKRFLDPSISTHLVVKQLNESKLLSLVELRHGIEVRAFSHVGRVKVGNLTITVTPKIKGSSLLNLVRYAYGFRRLNLIANANHSIDDLGFADLLVSQLNAEVGELLSRGLLKAYVSTNQRLSSPRGRIDIARIAKDGGVLTATLPCQHYPRIENTLLNQVLMAGLELGGSMTSDLELRRGARRLIAQMEEQVSVVRLDRAVMNLAEHKLNRLTEIYSSALLIIRLLIESQGVALAGETMTTTLPGFLFDMNAFFQALVSRFLGDNILGFSVRDEHGLKGMMRYNSKLNPQRRQSPTPRPDFVICNQRTGAISAILDAKYRDLWERPLPREMLYQLVVYAISQPHCAASCIIYPTTNQFASEARIDVSDPVYGKPLGQVSLRPLLLSKLESMIFDHSTQGRKSRIEYANQLAFGK
jgi:5-methylcytosine-specific restriction enzyme subunit McrC